MPPAASPRFLNFRLEEPLKSRVEAFEGSTGVSAPSITRELLKAAMDYFETHRQLVLPLSVIPKSELATLTRAAAGSGAQAETSAEVAAAAATLNKIAARLGIPLEAKLPKQPTTKSTHRSR
jgi:hypothetical protein